jgi:hypothetical protein
MTLCVFGVILRVVGVNSQGRGRRARPLANGCGGRGGGLSQHSGFISFLKHDFMLFLLAHRL